MPEQSTPPDVFSQRVAVLEGSIRHHESERQQAQQRADQAARRRDERRAELITYLKAQNTVLRQCLEDERQQGLLDGETIMRITEGLVADSKLEGFEEDADQNTSEVRGKHSPSKFNYGEDSVKAQMTVEIPDRFTSLRQRLMNFDKNTQLSPSEPEPLPGEEEGFWYLIELGHGDYLRCPGDQTVASKHLIEIRKSYAKMFPTGGTSRAEGHEPPVPKFYGCYGPYPHTHGGEDDPTGFRSYGAVATLEGRYDRDEIVRVRKPGGDRIEACDASTAPPAYLHGASQNAGGPGCR